MARSNPQEVADYLVAENGNVTRALATLTATMKRDPNPLWEQVRSELQLRKNRGEKSLDVDEPDEPVGAQVLRRVHEDGRHLLEEYDSWLGVLEHESVKNHVQAQLERLEECLTETEQLFSEEYSDHAPLEGAMDPEEPDEDDVTGAKAGKSFEQPDKLGLLSHHREKISKAKAYVEEVAGKERFNDEDRQKAYHHARELDGVAEDMNDPQCGKSVDYDSSEDAEAVQGAAKFLKELSTTRRLEYSHRSRAKSHIQPLDDLTDNFSQGTKCLEQKVKALNYRLASVL